MQQGEQDRGSPRISFATLAFMPLMLGLLRHRMHYTKTTLHAAEMKAGLETDSGDTLNEMFMAVRKVSMEKATSCLAAYCCWQRLEAPSLRGQYQDEMCYYPVSSFSEFVFGRPFLL